MHVCLCIYVCVYCSVCVNERASSIRLTEHLCHCVDYSSQEVGGKLNISIAFPLLPLNMALIALRVIYEVIHRFPTLGTGFPCYIN